MKPNPRFVAYAGLAMLGACTAGTDTLGNQLNQLQESGSSEENSTANAVE